MPERYYTPDDVDLSWAANTLNMLGPDGVIVMPGPGLAYQVDKEEKTLTLRMAVLTPEGLETHMRTIEVFKELDYTVFPAM